MRVPSKSQPPKKLVIKHFKVKPKLPEDFEEKTWAKLKDAVHAVQGKRPVTCSLEELYQAVEDLCLHKMASRLYTRLQNECDLHIGDIVTALTQKLVLEPIVFLQHVQEAWLSHCHQLLTLRSIFLHLDRTYIFNTAGVKSLVDMGLQLFRVHLAVHPDVEKKTLEGILALVEQERNGDAVDRSLLKTLLNMFSLLGIYERGFQSEFLSRTTQFYKQEGERLMEDADVPEYLQHCEKRLQEEYERSEQYLDRMTRRPLIQLVEHQILERHMSAVLEKGFHSLMDANRIEDLRRLYSLCGRISAQDTLKMTLRNYIRSRGSEIMDDEEKDKDMVEKLLDLKSRLDHILSEALQNNAAFVQALKEAFEKFINRRQNKPAELTAKFIDRKLRAGNKGQTEEELEATLERVLTIFRFIHGKDVFEAFYKKDLAKRLLLGKSASIDAEKSMIGKLKAECGSQFTNKLEGMFKDMDLSKDIMGAFKQSSIARDRISSIEMNVHVLTSGYWPTYPIMDARLPDELAQYQESFKQFYLQKHNGRRLQWYNSLGTCVLKARFPTSVKELQVSLFQTVVLMLFNDSDSMNYKDIREATGVEEKELRRVLQSLACGKVRVLLKEPKGRDVHDNDVFRFNKSFSDPHFRIRINTIQMKETEEENKKVNDAVMQDRQYQIDAAAVRIMKMRKTLSHKLLMQELLNQLKFPLKMTDVKKRVESLIEREYLERDPNTPNVYNYLA